MRRNQMKYGACGYADECDVSQLDMQRAVSVSEGGKNANGNSRSQACSKYYSPG